MLDWALKNSKSVNFQVLMNMKSLKSSESKNAETAKNDELTVFIKMAPISITSIDLPEFLEGYVLLNVDYLSF